MSNAMAPISTDRSTSFGSDTTSAQEGEYEIPYHHIPVLSDEGLRQHWYWSWGMKYLAGLDSVARQLRDFEWTSLRDIGCGDGRFVRNLMLAYPDRRISGADVSDKALTWARSFTPEGIFETRDIVATPPTEQVDVVTLVEVLEHIDPPQLDGFVAKIVREVRPGGWVIVTVPHVNVRVPKKHYQHFTEQSLRAVLSKAFDVEKVLYMDRPSRWFRYGDKLLGGSGESFLITHPGLRKALFDFYLRNCQFSSDEKKCGRLLAVVRPR